MADTLRNRMRRDLAGGALLRRAAEHALTYLEEVDERPVAPTSEALLALSAFDEALPDAPSEAAEVLDLLNRFGGPATMAQMGGRYFGFVNGGAVPIGLAARWLADLWDQNSALDIMSPVSARLEAVAEGWLNDLFGLPSGSAAGFVSGTSLATVAGLAAGRWRILRTLGWDVTVDGLTGAPPIRIITGRHTHSAVLKAVGLLGFGTGSIEYVNVDDQGRLVAQEMPPLDPTCLVILQAGNVNSGAFDPIDAVCEKANQAGAWVHIDGAFGLWAQASDRLRPLTAGMHKAQSLSVDGHKTLNTPYDCGIVIATDREALAGVLQASGAYLQFGGGRDGMSTTPEMSRRARGVEVWAILKSLGRAGVDELVTGLHDRAVQLGHEMAEAGFEVLNDVVFNQVLVALDTDAQTEALLAAVQAGGECWVGGSTWFGRKVIRVSISSWVTTAADVTRTVDAFVSARETQGAEAPARGTTLQGNVS
ncbi:MAG: aminotransferase class V-fold PLP-dependent enzyme [Pseudomonadota bacterium]